MSDYAVKWLREVAITVAIALTLGIGAVSIATWETKHYCVDQHRKHLICAKGCFYYEVWECHDKAGAK